MSSELKMISMKKYIFCFVSIVSCLAAFSQKQWSETADSLANRMKDNANRMLSLDNTERQMILDINKLISEQKQSAWSEIKEFTKLTETIQRIEFQRDSLYRNVLTDDKFKRYLKSKSQIISITP